MFFDAVTFLPVFFPEIAALTWLRYSLFIVLYPMGVAGELGVIYHTLKLGTLLDSCAFNDELPAP